MYHFASRTILIVIKKMPIFARRVIQRLLNENRLFIDEEKVSDHVKKLNHQNNKSIAAEWEIVILNALRRR